MAVLDQIELPNGTTYDIQDNQPAVLNISNTPTPIATFTGASNLPLSSLKVAVTPYQDLHGYDGPWAGGAWKNKLDIANVSLAKPSWYSGGWNNASLNSDYGLTIKRTYNEGGAGGFTIDNLVGGKTYTISFAVSDANLQYRVGIYYSTNGTDTTTLANSLSMQSGTGIKYYSFDLPSEAKYVCFRPTLNDGTSPYDIYKIQIEEGSSATSFAPYSNICPIIGWDEAVVTVAPLNISQLYNGQIYGDGSWVSNDRRLTNITSTQDNSYFLKAGTYTLDYDKLNSNAPNLLQCSALTKDGNYTIIDNFANEWNSVPFTFTLTQDGYFYFTIRKDADTNINPSDYRAKILGHTYTIDLDGTRYGGVVDATNGVMTVDRVITTFDGSNDEDWTMLSSGTFYLGDALAQMNSDTIKSTPICLSNKYKEEDAITTSSRVAYADDFSYFNQKTFKKRLWIKDSNCSTVEEFKTALANNPLQIVYPLATPITVQLAQTPVKSLVGTNNIFANCGQITEVKYVVSKYNGMTAKISEVAQFAKTANKQVPEIHRKYESTSYYAITASQVDSTWYFMSVKPDNWYKPWKVKFKVHTYCPNYPSYESITWSTFTGREQSLSYANFNERYDSAHYYISAAPLKKAGFDAGYGHALGISILYGGGYTTAAYYRTFEVDYYECENCTVTILDSPTKLTNWNGYSTINYNNVSNYDAINRGLRETSDDNDGHYYSRRIYSNIKAGSNKIFPYTLIMQNADGRWESLVTSNSTSTSKTRNTHGFRLNQILYMSANATYNENDVIGTYAVNEFFGNLLDHRYSFNTANNSTNGTTANTPIYLVGSINATDGLFYLDTKWWTQTLPTSDDGKLYIYLGDAYDYYRMIYSSNHPIYWYKGGKLQEYSQSSNYAVSAGSATSATSATTASKLGSSNVGSATQPIYLNAGTATACTYTLGKSVPSNAVFTDTKNTAGSTDTSSKIYLIGATSQTTSSQTYSQDTAYVGTDGCLYSHDTKVLTEADSPDFIGNIVCSNGTINVTPSAVSGSPGTYTINVQPWLVTDYGECSTAAATAAKVVTVTSNSFNLYSGVTVRIKFDYTNTASAPTLNVNNTGAKNIVKWGTTAVGTSASTSWTAGSIVSFTYDGTSWVMNDHIDDTNTNNAVTQTATDTTNATYELLFSSTADNTTRTEGARKSQYATFNPSKQAFTFGTRHSGSTIGDYSFAEGSNTTASGNYSHAEGSSTTASGVASHAEGSGTIASRSFSHAEGADTTASGNFSHAEGLCTVANHNSQHVFGEYNISDPSTNVSTARGTYIEIVGNGTSNTASNARTLDWSGNQWIAGNYSDTNGLLAMKEVTQAQYDALTTAEKNNGTAYFITDRLSPAATDLWTKVGTATLTTTAQDCSGAINELNANITNVRAGFELMNSNNINNTTATAFNLNGKLSDYHYICIQLRNYNNVYQTQFLSSSYFRGTGSGSRPMIYVYTSQYIGCIEVYYKSDTSVYIKASSGNTFTSNYRVVINGYEHVK